jgi:predicted ATPase
MSTADSSVRIRRLALRNYRSVGSCELEFSPLTVLVGRNGVGKSNIVDSLRFVTDALENTLEYAIRERGGINLVRRKSLGGRPTNPGIAVRVATGQGDAEYSFKIAAAAGGAFQVDREKCDLFDANGDRVNGFAVSRGQVTEWQVEGSEKPPASSPDRLHLVAASGFPQFRAVYDVLTRMTFHNLNPEQMKSPQRPEPGERLAHDGHNLASVIKRLQGESPEALERVAQYLRALEVPLTRIVHKHAGTLETIEVAQNVHAPDGQKNLTFDAASLSDGTIRAMGILVSLVSGRFGASTMSTNGRGPSLVGIEEPETALHPAAVGALVDALVEGAQSTQIVLTCHSPDMLDHEKVEPDMIRVVMLHEDRTAVGRLSRVKADLMRRHLTTVGELLRLDQLTPDPDEIARQEQARGTLFEAIA